MLTRELPVWVAAVIIVLVLLLVGIIYWRLSTPSETSQPPIRMPGVPITAQPPGAAGGSGPMPMTARPGTPPSAPPSTPPQATK